MNTQLIERGIMVTLDEGAWNYLIEKGYDDKMGARPMNRLIHEEIKVPLSEKILFDKLGNGVTIIVRAADGSKELELVVNESNTRTDQSLFEPVQGMWQEDKI